MSCAEKSFDGKSFAGEVDAFLENYPETEVIDVLIADMNGIYRGKQIPVGGLEKLKSGGIFFPITTCFLTTDGANADSILDDYSSDPDRMCLPVAGSLQPVPWANRPTGQVTLTMVDVDNSPFFMDPRAVLGNMVKKFYQKGLTPVAAIEYEFFLFEIGTMPPKAVSPPNGMPVAKGANCYNMDVQSDFDSILHEIEVVSKEQGLDVNGLVCEYGNGQFEVNLEHQADVVRACDQAMMLKRVIKGIALKHGLHASFMAKPIFDEAGNGMHAHVSLLNADGDNVFGLEDGEEKLAHAVGGLVHTMKDATAFFAPNANSYRRFDPDWFAPIVPNWGENNRRLSVRLPMAGKKDRRFEHRVAGADACPHLVLAAVLGGALYGLENACDPGEKIDELAVINYDDTIPVRWHAAVQQARGSMVVQDLLGSKFVELYTRIRESEEHDFHNQVGSQDLAMYFRVI